MPPETPRAFDPAAHLTEHRGRKVLEVRWRLLWLRAEHPDARIETEEIDSGEDWVKFRATVGLSDGGGATGHALGVRQDAAPGWYETAETKALGRALAALGYGTQYATEFDTDTAGAPGPAETPIEFPRPRPRAVRETAPTATATTAPARPRNSATWSDFWKVVNDRKAQDPAFDEAVVVGREPSRRMTADEAMRLLRAALGQTPPDAHL